MKSEEVDRNKKERRKREENGERCDGKGEIDEREKRREEGEQKMGEE